MKKIKVSYLGLNSLFGRVTSNLLKQSPCIHKLTLYDDGAPSPAIEHPNVYLGRDSLQDAIKDVNIVVIGDEAVEARGEDRLRAIGPKVIRYTEAIVKFSPNAIVIVAASPLNILFPLIGNFLGPDWQDRLLGTTSVDTLRASRALDGLLDPQGQAHILPVIGGASLSTRIPLFSHICPQITVSNEVRDQITEKMKLFDSTEEDTDAIERAYTTVRFIHSVLAGMTRDTSVPEIAMTKTSAIPETNYFSLPILIGRKGIERAADLPKLDPTEEKLFLEAAQKLSEDSKTAMILSQQFLEENEAEDKRKETLQKIRNLQFHDFNGQELTSKLQIKKHKDQIPHSFRGSRAKKTQKSARKFLELPYAETAPIDSLVSSKSPEKADPSTNALDMTDDPESEYSDVLNQEVSEHLGSLKCGHEKHKCNLSDENTDDFSETLESEVDEHLSSLICSQKPRTGQGENANHKVPADASAQREPEPWSASSHQAQNRGHSWGGSESSDTFIVPSTPSKRMDKVIADSKRSKSKLDGSGETAKRVLDPSSPTIRINNAIQDSRKRTFINNKLEDKDAKKEAPTKADTSLQPEPNKNTKDPSEEFASDAKKELRPRDRPHGNIASSKADVYRTSDIKNELRSRDDLAENRDVETQADAKRELRPQDHSADSGVKSQTAKTIADAEKGSNLQGKPTGKEHNKNLPLDHSKKEQQANKKQHQAKAQTTGFQGTDKRSLEAYDEDGNSGDHMSKSHLMMLKRQKRQTGRNKQTEDADANQRSKVEEDRRNIDFNENIPSVAKDITSEVRTLPSKRQSRRVVPTRKLSDKRKRRGKDKMIFSRGKWKAQAEDDGTGKDAEIVHDASSKTEIPPTVQTNTSRKMDRAASDFKMIPDPAKHRETRKSNPQPSQSNNRSPQPTSNPACSDQSTERHRSPSPKAVNFKPIHIKPEVSSHLLTDATRLSKLNSMHQIKNEALNNEKSNNNNSDKLEPDFKLVGREAQKRKNSTSTDKSSLVRPKSRKLDHSSTPDKLTEEKELHCNTNDIIADQDLNLEKTMNYFMRQRKKGPAGNNEAAPTVGTTAAQLAPPVETSHKQKTDRKEENLDASKKLCPAVDLGDHKAKEILQNHEKHELYSTKNNAKPAKVTDTRDEVRETDNWESKYFTKASEMFFKMFRDTVTCTPMVGGSQHSSCCPSQDIFSGEPRKRSAAEMKNAAYKTEPKQAPTTPAANRDTKITAQSKTSVKCSSVSSKQARSNDKSHSKNDKAVLKVSPGKTRIRVDKTEQCQMHPEASTKTSNMCENVIFHTSTKNVQPSLQSLPKEQEQAKPKKESPLTLDKLYEESSAVPIIFGAKGDKSWRSVETNGMAKVSFEGLAGVVATSDKGRGDALNRVDFTVCRAQDPNSKRDVSRNGNSSKTGGNEGPKASSAPMKIPISSKTIKQVNAPYHMGTVETRKTEEAPKPEKSHKWERIVNAFRNIIISDIEGRGPRFNLGTPQTSLISTNTAKTVLTVKTPTNTQPHKPKDFKVKSKSELVKKRKHETAKKKRPSEPRKGRTVKNNPKKIVNYFSKRGASTSYDRTFDGEMSLKSEGMASQSSVSMGQNSTSFARPSKIK